MPIRMPIIALLAALLAAAHAAAQGRPPDNFVEWRAGLHSSAQPGAKWLARVKEKGYDVVINLAPPQSHGSLRDEGAIVGAQGVVYVNIPVSFSKPSTEDFRQFSEIVRANAGRNVLVHCQVNLRGSAFVFLHRVIHEKAPIGETANKLNAVWAPDRVWTTFIDQTLEAHGRKGEVF
jgi:protein tyrosine phosphatase (PTP) superfamily phosphohydrolase (DUF442 family)